MASSILAIASLAAQQPPNGAEHQKLRPAGVAGTFYPADPAALTAIMDTMLHQVSLPKINGQVVAAVSPHAGYPYSGPVAAYTYAALKGHKFSRVVVIAPSHYEAFDFTSVYDGDGYVTPLGTVPVDKTFVRELVKMDSSIKLSELGHTATHDGAEHAIEVELPWLQHVLGDFTLVPIVMGDQSYESSRALGLALAKLIRKEQQHQSANPEEPGGETLVLASSDLSHFHTYDEAEKIDHKTLNALQAFDYFTMSQNFQYRGPGQPGIWEACGGAPIVAAMIYAERMGARQAEVLRYANTGDVTGDHSRVVGYSADVFLKAPDGKATEAPFTLNEQEEKQLLALARNAVERAVRDHKLNDPAATGDLALDQERGAFVTLTIGGELRGCIGFIMPVVPLYNAVNVTAAKAAVEDPRFMPVSEQELPKLEYEISVLSPLVRVLDVNQIVVGKHGLLMKNGDREGLLLPQVPVEQHWDRNTFLEQTCVKAGMPRDCWKDENTDIFRFTAFVFDEHHQLVAN
ncbi:MAG TPA: AmmeMemoRadiSam system protein B [Terracidiphilus sp.]|nr:AmmeMemoRadiSam system protein B [Terracidiphilus sp.]